MSEPQGNASERRDYIAQIWALCTTMSSEAIDAAEKRAKDNQFNVDRGEITFTEVGINLASARETLMDAIQKKKLIQLPITIQKEIYANLHAISDALQGIMNNSDEVVNLGSAVELLNTSIWKYGLHNLSEQVLGYQTKLNQLKQQEVRAKDLLKVLTDNIQTSETLYNLVKQIENDSNQVSKSKLSAEQDASIVATLKQTIQEELTKAVNAASGSSQAEAQATQNQSQAKAAMTEINSLEASIKSFYSEIDGYRRQMTSNIEEANKFLNEANAASARNISETNQKTNAEIERLGASAKALADTQTLALTSEIEQNKLSFAELTASFTKTEAERKRLAEEASKVQIETARQAQEQLISEGKRTLAELEKGLKERSEETIEKNYKDTVKHVEELAVLKESVKEQVAQATGLGQFGAFQSRQNKISSGKYLWVGAIALLVLIVVSLTYFIASHAQTGDLHSAAFWIKISMNIPLGFLITFCTIQYNRERRLEEEYAFKASISVSLNPYRELIYSILEKDGSLKDGTYTSFVVDSVRNVFTSPTEKIYEGSKGFEGVTEKSLKATAELVGTVVKAAK